MSSFLKNYLSTISFILIAYLPYSQLAFFQNTYSLKFVDFSIHSLTVYKIIILLYSLLLIPFYYNFKGRSKARKIIEFFQNKLENIRYKITKEEQVAILAWCVKIFFTPLMLLWATDHIITFINNSYFSYNDIHLLKDNFFIFFNRHFFYFFFVIILSVDTFFFTLGYLLEHKKLNNEIRSVEPTILGWFVVLICYPPLNSYTTEILGWYSTDFPSFINEYVHVTLNICILILMGIYSRASVSLGLKASNLTNRGTVKKGPYKYIRHPAYITKNLAWWIGGLPLLYGNLMSGESDHFFIVFGSLFARSTIYYLRAMTEERHLSMDPEYLEYKNEVKHKFIPKIY